MSSPEYLTPEQVGEILAVSIKTVLRLAAKDPTMPVLRLNTQTIRFPRERLLRWLQQREGGRSGGRSAQRSAQSGLAGFGGGTAV